jgi:hypothetical protein
MGYRNENYVRLSSVCEVPHRNDLQYFIGTTLTANKVHLVKLQRIFKHPATDTGSLHKQSN